MAANDAFTAGVRPGGLTSSTEIRLLLCYLVKNAGPITRQEIENALMEEALVNYFEIGSGSCLRCIFYIPLPLYVFQCALNMNHILFLINVRVFKSLHLSFSHSGLKHYCEEMI